MWLLSFVEKEGELVLSGCFSVVLCMTTPNKLNLKWEKANKFIITTANVFIHHLL